MDVRSVKTVACALLVLLLLAGCARRAARRLPAEVATPPPPAAPAPLAPEPRTKTSPSKPSAPTVQPPSARSKAIADTTAAGRLVRRCRARKLLPEDEATRDATLDLLRQARAAFSQGNVDLAASHARSAKQLAGSLSCP